MNLATPYRMSTPPADLVTKEGRSLPLISATLRATAGGGIARVVLEQTFENDGDTALTLTYRMPLPADGAVSGYAFTIGDRTISGKVEPKAKAREHYEAAIARGQTAAILDQERADIFTQELGNVPPRETIVSRLTIDMRLAWLPEGEWELRFPTVIGPRFVDNAPDAKAVAVTTSVVDTGARIRLKLDVRDELVRKATSPSHRIEEAGSIYLLHPTRLDRDIVVRWAVAKPEIGVTLAAARPSREQLHANVAYGLLTIVPPAAKIEGAVRDLVVLLDTSGSMDGPPLEQAKRVVSLLVESLRERDRIEFVEFSSSPNAWKREAVAATKENKRDALAWLRARKAGGSTQMHEAVMEALRSVRRGAQRQVVLVTDGYIGGEQQVVDLCHERLPADARLHVVGVGSAVNRSLAQALARAGKGAEILVGLDEDPERGAKRLLDRTNAPVLTEVSLDGSGVVETAPQHVPDVFAGAPVVCSVKLVAEGGTVRVRGTFEGKPWERTLALRETPCGEGDSSIIALYAREHVADLEMRWTIGREVEMIDRTIERVGTVFQIATRLTSWIAVDEVRHDILARARKVVQPQELPYGMSIDSFGIVDSGDVTRAGSITVEAVTLMQRLYSPAPMSALLGAPMPGAGAPPQSSTAEDEDIMTSVVVPAPTGAPQAPKMAMPLAEPIYARPSTFPAKRRRPWIWFALLLALVMLVAFVIWMLAK